MRLRLTLRPSLETLDDRCLPAITRPALFVPGQPASLPVSVVQAQTPETQASAFNDFIAHLGTKPEELTSIFDFNLAGLGQITSPTDALVNDLVSKGGYTLYQNASTVNPNLFVATQDWRMQIAPFDGVDDGILSNLTAQGIANDVFGTDQNGEAGVFRYGVDYLGYWMIKAMDAWVAAGGDPSVGVDVVSHSEGCLITRAYVSSAAYGGTYTGAHSGTLPEIANWVALAGPNEGASGIYNLLQNNFSNSLGSDLEGGLYLFEEAAYLRVTDPILPQPIFGPDGSPLITPADVASGAITTSEFIQAYIGSLRDEMPTYAFLDGQDVNDDPNFRNNLLLDVNGGLDPNAFASRVTESFTAIAGTRLDTLTTATSRTGTGGTLLPLDAGFTGIADVLEILVTGQLPPTKAGDVWIQDNLTPRSGDSVAATRSSLTTYAGDPRITVLPQDRSNITHNATVTDPYIHGLILNILQPNLPVPVPPGAQVVTAEFLGTVEQTFNSVRLTFNEDIDSSSFGATDVTLTRPDGTPIPVSSVTLVAGTKDQFDVSFPTQTVLGDYTIVVGTTILNTAGQQMDQNNNDINGQPGLAPAGDQFQGTGTLSIQPTAIFAVGASNGSVRILNGNGGPALVSNFRPLDVVGGAKYTGLVDVALGDLNGDGVADLFVSASNPAGVQGLSTSKAGRVFVYDGATLLAGTTPAPFHTFTPFATTDGPGGKTGVYINGLNIAVGDVDGDGAPDLIAGTRGNAGTAGRVEYARFVVITAGTDADGSDDSTIGSIIKPFGTGYSKGVVVAAGNLDGVGGDEIAVTRGGPVAASNPNKSNKLKVFEFAFTDLAELDLNGTASGAFAPFPTIERDGGLAFVDPDGDGKQELAYSALDRTDPTNPGVRIALFDINTVTGLTTAVSTGTGPSNSYVVGANIQSYAISTVDPNDDGIGDLALLTQSVSSGIQYLDPLSGVLRPGGFGLSVLNGGITLAGI